MYGIEMLASLQCSLYLTPSKWNWNLVHYSVEIWNWNFWTRRLHVKSTTSARPASTWVGKFQIQSWSLNRVGNCNSRSCEFTVLSVPNIFELELNPCTLLSWIWNWNFWTRLLRVKPTTSARPHEMPNFKVHSWTLKQVYGIDIFGC